ncbi:MAG TPA: tRNA pseudouridine(38-40) synthase TruA [bacterium]|nr:tRNA pseudouridine(38-40) synthase TruA [bacterium]
MNYLIVLEYDGTNFNGWQIQNVIEKTYENKTIEDEISKAISIVTKFNTKLFASGRTDAGVHAMNQVANFKLPFYYDVNKFKISLNGILPSEISVKNMEIVHDSFHATHDTVAKTYLYKINSVSRSPLLSGHSWFVKEELNFGLMSESARVFTGRNNFFNFAKREKKRRIISYYRVISEIKIFRKNYGFDILVNGEGFLRHMVRRIIGAIVSCGTGKTESAHLADMLEGKNLSYNVPCAPPCGLFLHSVRYGHKIYC